jgi:hypothetical protein
VAGTLLAAGASCTGIVGLDDYDNALETACKCAADDVGLVEECTERARLGFKAAEDSEVDGWLTAYASCQGCTKMQACFEKKPFCGDSNTDCVVSEQCCGYFGSGTDGCRNGKCGKCVGCANYQGAMLDSSELCDDVPQTIRECVGACGIQLGCKPNCFAQGCL